MSDIADEVGTPVYVYSTATLVRHARIMREALAELDDPLIAYAVKANPNPAVLATLARAGMGGDIVSIGEYRRARAAGMPPERILFSGVGKTADEMAEALAGGLLQFNLESVEEARTLSAGRAGRGHARAGRLPHQSRRRGRHPRQDHDRDRRQQVRHSRRRSARRLPRRARPCPGSRSRG